MIIVKIQNIKSGFYALYKNVVRWYFEFFESLYVGIHLVGGPMKVDIVGKERIRIQQGPSSIPISDVRTQLVGDFVSPL